MENEEVARSSGTSLPVEGSADYSVCKHNHNKNINDIPISNIINCERNSTDQLKASFSNCLLNNKLSMLCKTSNYIIRFKKYTMNVLTCQMLLKP